jgi:hypothetical protein
MTSDMVCRIAVYGESPVTDIIDRQKDAHAYRPCSFMRSRRSAPRPAAIRKWW